MMRFFWPWALSLIVFPLGILVFSWRRERRLLGRAVTLAMLVLAAAQPELGLRRLQEVVIFVVDRSASVGDRAVPPFWELARGAEERGAKVGVVVFAGFPAVVQVPSPNLPRALVTPMALEPARSDVGAALDLALALLPGPGQVVLISDGWDTEGNLWGAVGRARARGVPIHAFPVDLVDPVRLVSFRGPTRMPPGWAEFTAQLFVGEALQAELILSVNGFPQETRELSLSPGLHEERFVWEFPEPGVFWLTLRVEVPGDPLPQNNRLSWAVTVGEIPDVVVVGEGASALDLVLSDAGLPYRRIPSLGLPDLAQAGLVILDDHPLGLLGSHGVEALREFVAQGGGLWVILGRRALSGYAGPLEEILPVTFSVPQAHQEATAAVVFVLDRSASMAGRAGTTTKMELLKSATAAAMEWIPDQDWLGAVAFDRTPFWLAFPGPASSTKPLVFSTLAGLTPSGGTDLWPAVEWALSALTQVPARLRHIFLISDGKTVREGRNFQALYRTVAESGVGFTAIAVGPDADLEVLSGLAQAGGGEVHLLLDPTELRAVLVRETKRAVRPRFVEGEVSVVPGPQAEALAAWDWPTLFGYSLTFPRPTAEVALLTSLGDPLLVFGRVGLGRVAVLATDLRGVWSGAWVQSPVLGELLSQILARVWSERQAVAVGWEEGATGLRLYLDVAAGGQWVHGLRFSGTLVGPGEAHPLVFLQTGPGRYEGEVPALGEGVYLLSFSEELGRFGGSALIPLPYGPEFAEAGRNEAALARLTRLTGGLILEDEELPLGRGERREWVRLWPMFLWAGAGSFLVDLGLRKLKPAPVGPPSPRRDPRTIG